jgi:hypothetical protein
MIGATTAIFSISHGWRWRPRCTLSRRWMIMWCAVKLRTGFNRVWSGWRPMCCQTPFHPGGQAFAQEKREAERFRVVNQQNPGGQ